MVNCCRRLAAFELKDDTGRKVRLADLRGRVVLVTAIFSRWGYSCPMILNDVQNAVAALTPDCHGSIDITVTTLRRDVDAFYAVLST